MLVRYVACSARVGTAKQQKATGHNVCLCNIQHYGSCLPVPTQSHRLPVCLSSYFLGPSECVTRLRLVPWPLQGCSQPPTPNWVPAAFSLRLVLLGGRSGREASDSWHVPWPPQTADVERLHTQNWRVPSFLRGGLCWPMHNTCWTLISLPQCSPPGQCSAAGIQLLGTDLVWMPARLRSLYSTAEREKSP